jgi:predicted MPP superfamily phosphohydrolase
VLEPGSAPIRLLHISDLHMLRRHRHKARWVAALAGLRPDLVVNTGDTISDAFSIPAALLAFGDLLDAPGGFVFGNNDFYRPRPKSPHRYFTPRERIARRVDLPWRELGVALAARGWADLNNAVATITVRRQRVLLGGVNDPHTGRDHFDEIAGAARSAGCAANPAGSDASRAGAGPAGDGGAGDGAAVRIGVTHSPEPDVLDRFADDGYDLLLAGHTHGGQVRLPGVGALVTNCGLDRSRARGLSRWGARSQLHVSAGLGNSPYMPFRLNCRPEATLLTLVARG